MMIITLIFISALSAINELAAKRIAMNKMIQENKSILYAFDIFPKGFNPKSLSSTATISDIPWTSQDVMQSLQSNISLKKFPLTPQQLKERPDLVEGDSLPVWICRDSSQAVRAYGFYLKGKGLWGSMTAFAAVAPDFNHLVGIDFTEQVETPGLGARIIEEHFKHFFRNLNIREASETGAFTAIEMVRKKDQPNTEIPTNQFEAVTGATLTSTGVLHMLCADLHFYRSVIAPQTLPSER